MLHTAVTSSEGCLGSVCVSGVATSCTFQQICSCVGEDGCLFSQDCANMVLYMPHFFQG